MSEEYHLGTSDDEYERLAYQHQVWQDVSERLWRKAGFSFGQHLLDLGCGPGLATLDLARLVTSEGHIHAIDASQRFLDLTAAQLKACGLQQVSLIQGDVHHIDLADNSVDGVFVRWLLCFVQDPQQVISECQRVLRPGGALIAWDYYNYPAVGLFPDSEATRVLFNAYRESAVQNGGSYDIGNQLPGMFSQAGLQLEQLEPIHRIATPGSPTWHWAGLFHRNYVPRLVAQNLLSEQQAEHFWSDWEAAANNPAAFFTPPPMIGVIGRKAS